MLIMKGIPTVQSLNIRWILFELHITKNVYLLTYWALRQTSGAAAVGDLAKSTMSKKLYWALTSFYKKMEKYTSMYNV
jgi:hypothetical protein